MAPIAIARASHQLGSSKKKKRRMARGRPTLSGLVLAAATCAALALLLLRHPLQTLAAQPRVLRGLTACIAGNTALTPFAATAATALIAGNAVTALAAARAGLPGAARVALLSRGGVSTARPHALAGLLAASLCAPSPAWEAALAHGSLEALLAGASRAPPPTAPAAAAATAAALACLPASAVAALPPGPTATALLAASMPRAAVADGARAASAALAAWLAGGGGPPAARAVFAARGPAYLSALAGPIDPAGQSRHPATIAAVSSVVGSLALGGGEAGVAALADAKVLEGAAKALVGLVPRSRRPAPVGAGVAVEAAAAAALVQPASPLHPRPPPATGAGVAGAAAEAVFALAAALQVSPAAAAPSIAAAGGLGALAAVVSDQQVALPVVAAASGALADLVAASDQSRLTPAMAGRAAQALLTRLPGAAPFAAAAIRRALAALVPQLPAGVVEEERSAKSPSTSPLLVLVTALAAAAAAHAVASPASPLRRLAGALAGGVHKAAARIAGGQCPVVRRKGVVDESEEEESE